MAARSRERRPEIARGQRRLAEVEQELANIMVAIKAGMLTPTTKAELEKAEAERDRLRESVTDGARKMDKVVALSPRARECYEALVNNLARIPERHIPQAREQIRELVGQIKLLPTAEGYLEAEMPRYYEGLGKLAVGMKLNSVGCGGRI